MWAEVPGFPDYVVSSFGRVLHNRLNHEIKHRRNSYGHARVALRKDGKSYERYIHHLVAEAFMEGYIPGKNVFHVNEDKNDFDIYNLRMRKGVRLGQVKKRQPRPKSVRLWVNELDQSFMSVESCARFLETHPSNIYKVLRGTRETHLGYTFEWRELE